MKGSVIVSLVVVLGVCAVDTLSAQHRGARSTAMGGASVAGSADVWAVHSNPARLAGISAIVVSAFLMPELFGLKELRTVGIGGVMPVGPVSIGVNAVQFGFELYKETNVSASVGGEIDWDIAGGLTVHVNRFSFDRYGATTTILIDCGLQATPLKDLRLGFAAKNISGTTIGSTNERLPRLFTFGTAYSPIRNFNIAVELEKDVRFPLSLKAGVEQTFFDILSLRLGTSSQPDIFSGGIGMSYSMFDFEYAGFHHPDLGWTHQIEVGIVVGR
ncbi:MAG: hypothetical protein FJ215_04070 [Ignavibacteria bacterium]|nr:hypothetical protein [Ignavibacteria bacterium]